jgi:rhodanese-related sulfurtransferase
VPSRHPQPERRRSFRDQGFRNLYNLRGGIDAWSQLVDPSVPRY